MKVIATSAEMQRFAKNVKSKDKKIGFVPTMGALHNGHASLISQAKANCEVVVVSVFVNPTQFNQSSDLEKYPRTFDSDKGLLEKHTVDLMFFPAVDEIYPNDEKPVYNLGGLDDHMEGPNRPGHFNGVVQVVSRLFDLVQPDKAFFGEKDFQQLAILRYMMSKLGYTTEVIGSPTVREKDGLAMSSRNVRLSKDARLRAPKIYQALIDLVSQSNTAGLEEAKKMAIAEVESVPDFELEYLELVDATTLQPAVEQTKEVQACIAVWLDGVRLIDNVKVK